MDAYNKWIPMSSVDRVIKCSGSARISMAELPDSCGYEECLNSSDGIVAHEVAAQVLLNRIGQISTGELNRMYNQLGPTKQMLEAVKIYTEEVLKYPGLVFVEYPLEYGQHWRGRADAAVQTNGGIHIFEFKYGDNIKCSANSGQLKMYALGFAELLRIDNPDILFTLHLVQPRLYINEQTTWTLSELQVWYARNVRDITENIINNAISYHIGKHCQFCPRSNDCPEKLNMIKRAATVTQSRQLNADDENFLRDWGTSIAKWVEEWLDADVQKAVETGIIPDGYSVKYTERFQFKKDHTDQIVRNFRRMGFPDDKIYKEPQIRPAGQWVEVYGKEWLTQNVPDCTEVKKCKPRLIRKEDAE